MPRSNAIEPGTNNTLCTLATHVRIAFVMLFGSEKAVVLTTQRLAEQGHAWVQYNLGVMYDQGKYVAPNATEAVKWWHKAAEQGHSWAQYNLGNMYLYGKGVSKDNAEAAKWYCSAAMQGMAWAQYGIGTLYADGVGVPENKVLAYAWISIAATQGNKMAITKGQDVATSMTQAQIAAARELAKKYRGGVLHPKAT